MNKISQIREAKNTKPRQLDAASNAGWNAFLTFWSGIVSFLMAPFLIHYFGTDHYGIFMLIWSVAGILGVMNFGLGEATLRYVAHHHGDENIEGMNRVFGAALSFYIVICILVSIAMYFCAPVITARLKIDPADHALVTSLLRLSAAVFTLHIFTRAFSAVPMALQRYDVSCKINIGQNVMRTFGYIMLIILKFNLLYFLMWDIVSLILAFCIQNVVIKKLFPDLRLMPSLSFQGLKEIYGYSFFSLLTHGFYITLRESGKILLATYLGPSPVAYFGTPDNISQRVHTLIANSSETLLPRFSANRDQRTAQDLFLNGTWASLTISLVLFIPLIVLMPDFLRLWINPDFAREGAAVGQLVALSYITQSAYGPAGAFLRGTGKPWIVTVIFALASISTVSSCVLLIPHHGILGVGYAYIIGSVAHLLGLVVGWRLIFGRASILSMTRTVALPLILGSLAFFVEKIARGWLHDLNWFGLIALGAIFAGFVGLLIFSADWILGGDSSSKKVFLRIIRFNNSNKVLI